MKCDIIHVNSLNAQRHFTFLQRFPINGTHQQTKPSTQSETKKWIKSIQKHVPSFQFCVNDCVWWLLLSGCTDSCWIAFFSLWAARLFSSPPSTYIQDSWWAYIFCVVNHALVNFLAVSSVVPIASSTPSKSMINDKNGTSVGCQ